MVLRSFAVYMEIAMKSIFFIDNLVGNYKYKV